MVGVGNPGSILVWAGTAAPFGLALWLAGPAARRDLVVVDLFLAGVAGAAIGFVAMFVPGFVYAFGAVSGALPVPSLSSDHSDLMLLMLAGLVALTAAWFGFLAGLAHELRELGRCRAAGVVLISPLAVYLIGTGIYATLGTADTRDYAHFSIIGLPPLLAAVAGLWVLITQNRPSGKHQTAPPEHADDGE